MEPTRGASQINEYLRVELVEGASPADFRPLRDELDTALS